MTVNEMLDWFDIIQDKSDSPFFNEAEKLQFLNRAQTKFVNEYIQAYFTSSRYPRIGAKANSSVEESILGLEVLNPLIIPDISVSSDANGKITHDSINSGLQAITSDTTEFIAILSVGRESGANEYPVRFVRHNDKLYFKNNVFKKGTATDPVYTLSDNSVKFDPVGIATYNFTVLKEPVQMETGTPTNSELPAFVHDRIIAIALDDAGVSSRDAALLQMQSIADQNINPIT